MTLENPEVKTALSLATADQVELQEPQETAAINKTAGLQATLVKQEPLATVVLLKTAEPQEPQETAEVSKTEAMPVKQEPLATVVLLKTAEQQDQTLMAEQRVLLCSATREANA